MKINEIITEEALDEIDSKGLLKALGAGALALGIAGGAGAAKADTTFGDMTQHDNGATTYQSGPMRITQNPDKSIEAEYRFYDNVIKTFQRGNVSGTSAQGSGKDVLINIVKTAQSRGIDTQSPRFQKFLQSLPGYTK